MIPHQVWITDPIGFYTYFMQRWIGFSPTLADSARPDMWNNLLHPDDQNRARQVWGGIRWLPAKTMGLKPF